MYNPQDEEHLGEIFVRREISRVFDICLSCRRCVDTCGVFPSLVETIEHSSLSDAGMLTPLQQDEILGACHLCMQCVVQCPYGDLAPGLDVSSGEPGSLVHFPQLVVRHRAMLWSQGGIDLRQRFAALFLSYSARLILRIKIVRSVVKKLVMSIAWQPSAGSSRISQRKRMWLRIRTSSPTDDEDVVIFPTCVVDQHHAQLVDDFISVCHSIDIRVRCSDSFVCCGAPDLYSGNLSRFRRIARKNSAVIAREASRGRTVVVGQSRCVSVMKEMYPSIARHKDIKDLSENLVGMTEYLGQQFSSQSIAQVSQCSAGTRVVMLESSAQRLAMAVTSSVNGVRHPDGDTVATSELLRLCGADVVTVKYPSFVDTVWSAQHRFNEASVREVRNLVDAIDGITPSDPHRVVLGESCLTNAFFEETSGRPVMHPVSFLAQQTYETSPHD